MFFKATIVDFALKMILLFLSFLLTGIPSLIADSERSSRSSRTVVDINKINEVQDQWKAEMNYFANLSDAELLIRMGTRKNLNAKPLEKWNGTQGLPLFQIPVSFDARKKWPGCYTIGEVKDQGNCGSCWAVSSSAAYTDRLCIAKQQNSDVEYSAEDILTCCQSCIPPNISDGCQGGFLVEAWDYLHYAGVVTGGNYGARNTCKPYSIPACRPSLSQSCAIMKAPPCRYSCTSPTYKIPYQKDKTYARNAYLLIDEQSAKLDLMRNGPITAMLTLCYDFYFYAGGIYYHVDGIPCQNTFHSVKVIGWGQDYGVNYWLAVNSWNTTWGMKGLFKIDVLYNNVDFGHFVAGAVS